MADHFSKELMWPKSPVGVRSKSDCGRIRIGYTWSKRGVGGVAASDSRYRGDDVSHPQASGTGRREAAGIPRRHAVLCRSYSLCSSR